MEVLRPQVSVLLPVRQWRDTTVEAVNSLLNQTLAELEILVIGHDDVDQIMGRLPNDDRIRGVARRGNGIVNALNTGLSYARAPYVARMDDDDIAYPQRLESQLAYLQSHRHVDLCATKIRFIDETGSHETIRAGNRRYAAWLNSLESHEDIAASCYIECPMPHPTLFAHRDVWQALNGYREFDGPEDYDLILRALLAGKIMGKPNMILQDWREHPERLTYKDERYRREAFTRCRARTAADPNSGLQLHNGRSVWICGTGKNARHWHDALIDQQISVEGFVDINPETEDRLKRDKPIIHYDQLPERRKDSLVITALSDTKAQVRLQAYFEKLRWSAGIDYIFGA